MKARAKFPYRPEKNIEGVSLLKGKEEKESQPNRSEQVEAFGVEVSPRVLGARKLWNGRWGYEGGRHSRFIVWKDE